MGDVEFTETLFTKFTPWINYLLLFHFELPETDRLKKFVMDAFKYIPAVLSIYLLSLCHSWLLLDIAA